MPDCGGYASPLRTADLAASRRRPVNKGGRRGVTQAPQRPRRKRRR